MQQRRRDRQRSARALNAHPRPPVSAANAAQALGAACEPIRRVTRHAIGQFMLESLEQRQMLSGNPPSISGNPSVQEGSPYTLQLSAPHPEQITQWAIDWGDGADADHPDVQDVAGSATSAAHTYVNGPRFYAPTALVSFTDGTTATAALPAGVSTSGGGDPSTPLVTDDIVSGQVVNASIPLEFAHSNGVLLQPDGKLVVLGREADGTYVLARYNADNTPDTTFGDPAPLSDQRTGKLRTTFGTGDERVIRLKLLADGKILAVGLSAATSGGNRITIVRFTADGQVDTSFGPNHDGVVVTGLYSHDANTGLQLAQDGGFFVAGAAAEVGSSDDIGIGVERFDANGNLATSYGQGGMVTTPLAAFFPFGVDVPAGQGGALLIGGYVFRWTAENGLPAGWTYRVLRFDASGATDTSFGNGGTAYVPGFEAKDGYDLANTVATQPDGNIVIAGAYHADNSGALVFAMRRLTPAGQADETFGTVMPGLVGNGDWSNNVVATLPDGKILAAGAAAPGGTFDVSRFLPDGTLDTTFGDGGTISTTFQGGNGPENALVLGADDGSSLAIAGQVMVDGAPHFAVLRLTPGGTLIGGNGAVRVDNARPVLGNLRGASAPAGDPEPSLVAGSTFSVAAGDTFFLAADFTDAGTADTHVATIDWGDGNGPVPADVSESGGAGTASGSHTFATRGLHVVTIRVTDNDGGSRSVVIPVSVRHAGVNHAPTIDTTAPGDYTLSPGGATTTPPGQPPVWTPGDIFVTGEVDPNAPPADLPAALRPDVGTGPITAVEYSPSGQVVRYIRLHHADASFELAFGGNDGLYLPDFGGTENQLGTSSNGGVNVVDAQGHVLTDPPAGEIGTGHWANPTSVAFDAAGDMFVVASGLERAPYDLRHNAIIEYDPAGQVIGVYNWNYGSDTIQAWEGHGTLDVQVSADQHTLYYSTFFDGDPHIHRLDLNTGQWLADADVDPIDANTSFRVLPDGGVLISDHTQIDRLDAAGHLIQSYNTSFGTADNQPRSDWRHVALTPDGKSFWAIAFGNPDTGTEALLARFDLETGALLQTIVPVLSRNDGLAVFREPSAATIDTVPAGAAYTYDARASDPDGDPVTYAFALDGSGQPVAPAGATVDPQTGRVTWAPPAAGTYTFSLVATDDGGLSSAPQTWQVVVTAPSTTNHAPAFTTAATLSDGRVNTPYRQRIIATDPDGDAVTYALVGDAHGFSLDAATGLLSGMPRDADSDTTVSLTVQASDPAGLSAQRTFTFHVQPANDPYPSVLGAYGDRVAFVGQQMVDPDAYVNDTGHLPVLTLPTHPDGMFVKPFTYDVLWTPTAAQAGHVYDVTARLRDQAGGMAEHNFRAMALGLTIGGLSTDGKSMEVTVTGTGTLDPSDTFTYTWHVPYGTPDGVTFSRNGDNAAKDTLVTFPMAGDYDLDVTVTDNSGGTFTGVVHVTVAQQVRAIAIDPPSTTVDWDGQADLSATLVDQFGNGIYDEFGDPSQGQTPFTWAITQGPGAGTLESSPYSTQYVTYHAPAEGSYSGPVTVTVSNLVFNGSTSITLGGGNQAPRILRAWAAKTSVLDNATDLNVTVQDDHGPENLTYRWDVVSAPAGAPNALPNAGVWTPHAGTAAYFHKAGTYQFQVTVSDAGGLQVRSNLITVVVVPQATSFELLPDVRRPGELVRRVTAGAGSIQYAAKLLDQFGDEMPAAEQPQFSWSLDPANSAAGGSITPDGLYTIPATAADLGGGYFATDRVVVRALSGKPFATQFDLMVEPQQNLLQTHEGWVGAIAGQAFQGVLTTFGDFTATQNDADYTVSIDWGDGTPATPGSFVYDATLSNSSGALVYDLSGSHTYGLDRLNQDLTATITITAPGRTAQAVVHVHVTDGRLDAAAQGPTHIDLSWSQFNAGGGGEQYTGYYLRRRQVIGSSTETDWVNVLGSPDNYTTDTGWSDTGLEAGAAYTYELHALVNDSDSLIGVATLRTWDKPAKPTNLTGEAFSKDSVHLQWDASTDPHVIGYRITRDNGDLDTVYVSAPGTPGARIDYYDDTVQAAAPGDPVRQYTYRVIALSPGDSANSPYPSAESDPVTVSVRDVLGAIGAPLHLQAGYAGRGRVGLQWDPVSVKAEPGEDPDRARLLGYDVFRSADPNFVPSAATLIGSSYDNKYTDDNVPPGTWYYRVEAATPEGDSVTSLPASVDTTVTPTSPAAPTNLVAKPVYSDRVTLSWHDASVNEAEFDIYRTDDGGSTPHLLSGVTQDVEQFTDDTVSGGGTYTYWVYAHNFTSQDQNDPGNDGVSQPLALTTPTDDNAPPVPQEVTAVQSDTSADPQVTVSWTEATGGQNPASQFEVFRLSPLGAWVSLGTVDAGWNGAGAQFVDTHVEPNTTYTYRVKALGTWYSGSSRPHSSAFSASASVRTIPATTWELQAEITNTFTPADPSAPGGNGRSLTALPFQLTQATKITGLVWNSDPEAETDWSLTLVPLNVQGGSTQNVPLASGSTQMGSRAKDAAYLAMLDPSRYANGFYKLVLTADDTHGNHIVVEKSFNLYTQAKLGGLTLPATDLSLDLPGAGSVTVSRSYDSQNLAVDGDFGRGWTLATTGSAVRTSADERQPEGSTAIAGLRAGDLVYVTVPGGGEHTFQFLPRNLSYHQSDSADPYGQSYAPMEYVPQFVALDGSGIKLKSVYANGSEPDVSLKPTGATGEVEYYAVGTETAPDIYSPTKSEFGGYFLLTMPDGSTCMVKASTGQLQYVQDANGSRVTYGTDGSAQDGDGTSAAKRGKLELTRDSHNHVVDAVAKIPATTTGGTATVLKDVKYVYDDDDLLAAVDVTDAARDLRTTYAYADRLVLPLDAGVAAGGTYYAVIRNAANNQIWNGSGWEAYDAGHVGAYAVAMTALTSPGIAHSTWYLGIVPGAIAPGTCL